MGCEDELMLLKQMVKKNISDGRRAKFESSWLMVEGLVNRLSGRVMQLEQKNEELIGKNGKLEAERDKLRGLVNKDQEKIAGIIDTTNIGISAIDVHGQILLANKSYYSQLGYSPDEMIGLSTVDISYHEDKEFTRQYLDQLRIGIIEQVSGEKRLIRKDKSYFWAEVTVTAFRNEKHQIEYLVETVADITARKRSEAQLNESYLLLRKLSLRVPGVIYQFRYHPDGRYYFPFASEGIYDIFEVRPREVKQDASLLVSRLFPSDRVKLMEDILHSFITLKMWEGEYRLDLPGKGIRWVQGIAKPEKMEDGSVLWHGYIQDVTGQKNMELALRESEAKIKAILCALPDFLFILDANGVYLDCFIPVNLQPFVAKEIFLGKNLKDILPPNVVNLVWPYYLYAMETHEMQSVEYSLPLPDGLRQYNARIVVYDEDKYLTVIRDITGHKELESTLKEQVEILETFFDVNLDLLCIADVEGNFIKVNKAWEKILGYQTKDLEQKKFLDFIHPEDLEPTLAAISQLKGQDDVYNFVNRYRCLDGTYRFIEWISHPSGKLIYAAARDITEHKHTEDELRHHHGLITALLDSMPDLIFYKDINGVYLGCNPAFAQQMGYAQEEITGHTDYELCALEKAEFYHKVDLEILQIMKTKNLEETIVLPDGRIQIIDTLKTPYLANDGSLIGILGISRDITERKMAEQSIMESEKKFHTIFDSANVGITMTGKNGEFLIFNNAWLEMIGYSPDELLKLTFLDITYIEDMEMNQGLFAELKTGARKNLRFEKRYIRKDNTLIWVDISVSPVQIIDNQVISYISVVKDITERKMDEIELIKQKKELQNLNQTKDKFFSIISHDLRNPFNTILGFSNLLLDNYTKYDEATREKLLTGINLTARNTYSLLENLLTWARAQSGKIEMRKERVNVQAIVRTIIELLLETALAKQILLMNTISDEDYVYADQNMLNTVFRNLISNAIKYTKEEGRVRVNAERRENYLEISISDNGIGMSEAKLATLFKIGETISSQGTEGELGTGLGLILCKEFIEKHGGKIWVNSEPQKGSTFYFTLLLLSDGEE
jgi:PAS domain S-box-containing protein